MGGQNYSDVVLICRNFGRRRWRRRLEQRPRSGDPVVARDSREGRESVTTTRPLTDGEGL